MKKAHKICLVIILLVAFLSGVFLLKKKLIKKSVGSDNTQMQTSGNLKSQNNKFSETETKNNIKSVKILFVGDLMFDRYIRQTAKKNGNGFIFEKIKNLLKKSDLVVANLEGPITDNQSVSMGTLPSQKEHFVFTFNKSICTTLADNNIRLINIGNNHILNFSKDGLSQTKTNLDEKNVNYFGDTGENVTHLADINNYKIGFVNYNQFSSGSLARTLENIKNLQNQSDIIIVYTHWGIEYQTKSSKNIRDLGHQFIDSGADLVIGSHPHVIQEKEDYKGRWIYYSLGNFIFDQYFSPETKKGLAIEVSIDPDKKMDFTDIPLILDNNGQTRVNAL